MDVYGKLGKYTSHMDAMGKGISARPVNSEFVSIKGNFQKRRFVRLICVRNMFKKRKAAETQPPFLMKNAGDFFLHPIFDASPAQKPLSSRHAQI